MGSCLSTALTMADEVDLEDLLAALSAEELSNLVDEMAADPDDKHMPASVRTAYRCEKDPTGDLNRDSLINHINEIALNTPDKEENGARKAEIAALDSWAKGENDARKTEIANLKNFAESENDARKTAIANLDNFAKSENDGRKADIAALNKRADDEAAARGAEDAALNDRISKEISDRENSNQDLQNRMDSQNSDRISDIEDLKTRIERENAFLKSLNGKTLGISFNAYRTKAYDGGGEENLTFQGTYCNNGGGLDIDTGIFTCPCGGTYMFQFHIATHDNKKALLSIRKNGEEVASIFDQNHKDNHKNSMAGQSIVIDCVRGDEIVIYAYTGTWLADFPMNHYTHWVGILLKPDENEYNMIRKSVEEGVDPTAPVPCQPDNDYE